MPRARHASGRVASAGTRAWLLSNRACSQAGKDPHAAVGLPYLAPACARYARGGLLIHLTGGLSVRNHLTLKFGPISTAAMTARTRSVDQRGRAAKTRNVGQVVGRKLTTRRSRQAAGSSAAPAPAVALATGIA